MQAASKKSVEEQIQEPFERLEWHFRREAVAVGRCSPWKDEFGDFLEEKEQLRRLRNARKQVYATPQFHSRRADADEAVAKKETIVRQLHERYVRARTNACRVQGQHARYYMRDYFRRRVFLQEAKLEAYSQELDKMEKEREAARLVQTEEARREYDLKIEYLRQTVVALNSKLASVQQKLDAVTKTIDAADAEAAVYAKQARARRQECVVC